MAGARDRPSPATVRLHGGHGFRSSSREHGFHGNGGLRTGRRKSGQRAAGFLERVTDSVFSPDRPSLSRCFSFSAASCLELAGRGLEYS